MVKRHILVKDDFVHILTAFGDKLNEDEIDDIFGEFEFDDNGDVMTKSVVDLFVPGAMDEKKEDIKEIVPHLNSIHPRTVTMVTIAMVWLPTYTKHLSHRSLNYKKRL